MYLYNIFLFFSKLRNYATTRYFRKQMSNSINYLKHPFICNNYKYITLGTNFSAMENIRLDAIDKYNRTGQKFNPQIIIGNNVIFNKNIHIGCIDKIEICDNCLFASDIFISDHYHGDFSKEMDLTIPFSSLQLFAKPIRIGSNCWIGEKVSILPGAVLGDNCIVGANSVANKEFPDNCMIAGAPAKIIKRYNKNNLRWESV